MFDRMTDRACICLEHARQEAERRNHPEACVTHLLLGMLKEDLDHIGAEDLHQLQRTWELNHRLTASFSVAHHTLFREETRWPGYYYREDHMQLNDTDWHCFTLSQYDRESGDWAMEKAPVYHIVD